MCCGSRDDYEPQAQYQHSQQHPQHRRPRDDMEKQRRQAEARRAAQQYGWPNQRRPMEQYSKIQCHGVNRDSYLHPAVNSQFVSMPGMDFRAVYDPSRPRQPQRPSPPPQRRQPQQRAPAPAPQRRPVPAYIRQRSVGAVRRPVVQQPAKVQPMSAVPIQNVGAARRPEMVYRPPGANAQGRQAVIQHVQTTPQPKRALVQHVQTAPQPQRAVVHQASQYAAPQATQLVRRASNAVSDCSSDDNDPASWRKHTVSPMQSPLSPRRDLYNQMGMRYGRGGKAF